MEPYDPGLDPGELGGVGEGVCVIDGAQPLTQLQLGNKLPSLRNPLLLRLAIKDRKSRCLSQRRGGL
jgi:hypothetical protein